MESVLAKAAEERLLQKLPEDAFQPSLRATLKMVALELFLPLIPMNAETLLF